LSSRFAKEILMHKDRPSSAQWPLQVGIDPYAAMVLRAIPPEIAKSRLVAQIGVQPVGYS
jgi:hypothetical protein